MKQCSSYGTVRRTFLMQIGALPILGLNLINLLKYKPQKPKSCILFYLGGGISHIDTYDPKPEAPLEIRGEYKTISTNVPGIQLSDRFPKQAAIADKLTLIRSFTHDSNDHTFAERRVITGYSAPGYPCFESVLVNLLDNQNNNSRLLLPYAFLGPYSYNYIHTINHSRMVNGRYNPFFIEHNPNKENFSVEEVKLANGLTVENLKGRRQLLQRLDALKNVASQKLDEADEYWWQAFELLTGNKIAQAFDIGEETRSVCDFYGRTEIGLRALLARRLIEAGAKFVAIHARGYDYAGWDYHNNIFDYMSVACPPYDQAIAALIADLSELGMLDEVLVLAFGEFGRTPRINGNAGRDHWPRAGSVLMAGGGIGGGRVYGATNSRGEEVKEKPVSPENFLATLFHLFGFEPETYLVDKEGRRYFIAPENSLVIKDLF